MNEENKKEVPKKIKEAFNNNNKSDFDASKTKEKVKNSLKNNVENNTTRKNQKKEIEQEQLMS